MKSSPSRSLSSKEISEIPVQKIDLEVPLHTISGLANIDHYIDMKKGKKGKDKKKKKKKGKDKKESEEEPEEEDQTPSVFVSRNAEMPEGYVSDGKFQFKFFKGQISWFRILTWKMLLGNFPED